MELSGILVKTSENRVPARGDSFQAARITAVAGGPCGPESTDGKIGTQPGGITQSKGAREAEAARKANSEAAALFGVVGAPLRCPL